MIFFSHECLIALFSFLVVDTNRRSDGMCPHGTLAVLAVHEFQPQEPSLGKTDLLFSMRNHTDDVCPLKTAILSLLSPSTITPISMQYIVLLG